MIYNCLHPGCSDIYETEKKTKRKYCDEHMKVKYNYERKKLIEAVKAPPQAPQATIDGILYQCTIGRYCKACGRFYETTAYYNAPINSDYCENHRNEFRRNLYLRSHEAYNGDQPVTPNHVQDAQHQFKARMKVEVEASDVFNRWDLDQMIARGRDFFPLDSIKNERLVEKILGNKTQIINMLIDFEWIEKTKHDSWQSLIGD